MHGGRTHGTAWPHSRPIAAAATGLVALVLGLTVVGAPPASAEVAAPLAITSPVAGAAYDNVIHVSYSLLDVDPATNPALELTGPGCGSTGLLYMLSFRLSASFDLDLRDPEEGTDIVGRSNSPQGIPAGCTPTGLAIYAVRLSGDPVSAFVTGFTSSITSLSPATTQYVVPDPMADYVTIGSQVHSTYSCFGAGRVLPCPAGGTSRLYLTSSVLPPVDLATGDSSGVLDWSPQAGASGDVSLDVTYPGLPTRPSGTVDWMSIREATTAVTNLVTTTTNTTITATWSPPTVWGGGTYAVSVDGGVPVTTNELTYTASGLAPRSTHTVSVTPSDYSYGNGPATTATATTGPLTAALGALTQGVAAPTVTTPVTLSGHLLVGGSGAAGLPVTLYGRTTTNTWSLLGSTTTTAGGAYAFARTFSQNTTVQARFAGTSQVSAGTSTERLVTVRPVLSFVMTTKAGTKVTKVKVGTPCLAKVTLTGVRPGTTVYLQYYSGGAWHTIKGGTAVSKATSASIPWTPSGKGARQVHVTVRADSTHAAGVSSTYTLTVT